MADPAQKLPVEIGSHDIAPMSEFVIKVQNGDLDKSFRMSGDTMRVGRGKECDIVLGSSNASRLHCVLQRNGSDLILLDNNTRNGTFINGSKVTGPVILKSGDRIQVADTVLQFRKFSRKQSGGSAASASQSQARGIPAAELRAPDRMAVDANMVEIPKGRIPPRFMIYGVVLLAMTALIVSNKMKKVEEPKIDAEYVKENPIEAYQMYAGHQTEGDLRSEAIMKASKEIAETTATVISNLEVRLKNEEAQKILDSLKETGSAGQPLLKFNQKLALEHYFAGIREYNYQNFIRAETHFREAMTFDPSLEKSASDYLNSSRNRRRLQALKDYRLANKYYFSKKFDYAIGKFRLVMDELEADKSDDPQWEQIYKNCERFITASEAELGLYNSYKGGTTQ